MTKKLKLEKRFIDESIRIREEYLKNLVILKEKENHILKIKTDLNETYDTIQKPVNEIDKEMMDSKIDNMTKDIKKMQDYINPIIENIKKLGKEADLLFEEIRNKHPNITKNELIKELQPHIKIIDDKYNLFKNP